jgi:Rap1a immunity proteins
MLCRKFDFTLFGFLFLVSMIVVLLCPSAWAASEDQFHVRTTNDYVALCTTQPGQENYVAAIHFCQGFASGAYQYYMSLADKSPADRYVCLTDPTPSRDQALAAFVAWVKANPSSQSDPPVDSIFHYLAQAYPCSSTKQAAQ